MGLGHLAGSEVSMKARSDVVGLGQVVDGEERG